MPERGDFIWLNFDPQAGREQAGRRPAIVLSAGFYNVAAELAVVCPITRQSKGYPFEVSIPAGLAVTGVVLTDHVRSLDWRERRAEYIDRAPAPVIAAVSRLVARLIGA